MNNNHSHILNYIIRKLIIQSESTPILKTPWAHLDIAGMAWDKADKPLTGKGATGYGVRLLNEFLTKNFEA